jgi:hypothetical protein
VGNTRIWWILKKNFYNPKFRVLHMRGRIHGRHEVHRAIDDGATTHTPPRLHGSPTAALARIPEQELRQDLATSARFTSGASLNTYFSPSRPSLFNLVRSRIATAKRQRPRFYMRRRSAWGMHWIRGPHDSVGDQGPRQPPAAISLFLLQSLSGRWSWQLGPTGRTHKWPSDGMPKNKICQAGPTQ